MTNPSNNPLAPPQLPPQGDAQQMAASATPHAAVTVAAAPVFPTVANATAAALLNARNSGAAATANNTAVEQMAVSQKRLKLAHSLEGGELTEEVLHHHAHLVGASYTLAVESGYVNVNPTLADIQAQIAGIGTQLQPQFDALRTEITSAETRLRTEITSAETRLCNEITSAETRLCTEIDTAKTELGDASNANVLWTDKNASARLYNSNLYHPSDELMSIVKLGEENPPQDFPPTITAVAALTPHQISQLLAHYDISVQAVLRSQTPMAEKKALHAHLGVHLPQPS